MGYDEIVIEGILWLNLSRPMRFERRLGQVVGQTVVCPFQRVQKT